MTNQETSMGLSDELKNTVQGLAARLDELESKQEIHEVLMRYARGDDRGDVDMIADCFHPDALDIHGTVDGTPRDLAEFTLRWRDGVAFSMHTMPNILIELDGDRAVAETYAIGYHRVLAGGSFPLDTTADYDRDLMFGYRYIDRFERRDSRWRIAHRQLVFEWTRVDRVVEEFPVGENWVFGTMGSRGSVDREHLKDPIYAFLQELRSESSTGK